MVIEDAEPTPGKPKYLFIVMNDPPVGANTWAIKMTNTWFGLGSGEYKVVGFSSDVLEFREGPWDNGVTRMQFFMIHYPSDCRPQKGGSIKTGTGWYATPFRFGVSCKLKWSGRNIVPEELP
jgi:hypothetical protein